MGIYDFSVEARSRDQQLKEIMLDGEEDLKVGFLERFSQARGFTYDRHTNPGRAELHESQYRLRDQILMDAGLTEKPFQTTQRIIDKSESGNFPFLNSDYFLGQLNQRKEALGMPDFDDYLRDNEKNDELLIDFISSHPELGILSDDEIRSNVTMDQFESLNRDQDLADRSTWGGKAGWLAGSMIGWLQDPVNSLSGLLGLSPVRAASAAQNFFNVGGAEAVITGILNFKNKPSEFEFRKKFGEPDLTVSDVEKEALLDSLFSFVFGGSVGSIGGRFIRPNSKLKIPESENNLNNVTEATQAMVDEVRTRQSRGESFDIEVEQATDLLEETLNIARGAPKDTSYERHMTNYASARMALAEGLDVKGVDDLSRTFKASDQTVEPPDASKMSQAEASIDVQDTAIAGLRQQLDKSDVLTTKTGTEGGTVNISSREILDNLDSQQAAVKATIDCLG